MKRLYRSTKDKLMGGVCGGIGNYLDIDPVIVRLIWVLFAFAFGFAFLIYIIAWIVIPLEPIIPCCETKEDCCKEEEEEEVK